MEPVRSHKGLRIAGLILHVLVGVPMILAGFFKLLGLMPKEAVAEMAKNGVGDKLVLIGAGELIAALLLIVPMTSKLGVLLTSGFWGGVICFHMVNHDNYIGWSVFLLLTWVGAYLRTPEMFPGLVIGPRAAPVPAH